MKIFWNIPHEIFISFAPTTCKSPRSVEASNYLEYINLLATHLWERNLYALLKYDLWNFAQGKEQESLKYPLIIVLPHRCYEMFFRTKSEKIFAPGTESSIRACTKKPMLFPFSMYTHHTQVEKSHSKCKWLLTIQRWLTMIEFSTASLSAICFAPSRQHVRSICPKEHNLL